MVDFGKAIGKPFSNTTTLIIGMILAAIPVVNILVTGYALKIAQETIKGKGALISWKVGDIVDYIIKFIMSAIISIVYMIIPLILIAIGLGAALFGFISNNAMGMSDPNASLALITSSLAVGGPFIVIGVILAVLAALVLPMANMKWLKSGSFGAAFNVGDVIKSCLTADYIVVLIVSSVYAIVLLVVLGAIAGALMMVPAIGFILGALVMGLASFAVSVTTMSLFAQTVK